MPAQVETMAYANEVPWHGLGVNVSDDLSPEAMLQAAGLDWEVRKSTLWTNTKTFGPRKLDDKFALMRWSDGKILDVVGKEYVPTQNIEAFRFFKRFTEAGHMKMETAGSLQGGRRIWGLANIQSSFSLAGGDKVTGYLLVSSPHIYGESLQIRFVATRVVCMNTLSMALKEKGTAGKYRMLHFQKFDDSEIAKAELALGISNSLLTDLKEKAQILSNVKAPKKKVLEYVSRLFDPGVFGRLREKELKEKKRTPRSEVEELEALYALDSYSPEQVAVELNRASQKVLRAIVESPGADMLSAKDTWWGALNGVTYVVDHNIGHDRDTMLTSAWLGRRAALKEQALELALEYVGVKDGN